MTLRQDGETLQGVFKGERGELPFEGRITGSTITVSYTVDFGGNEITIRMTGEVEGEEVRGQGDFGGFAKFEWSGNRTARLALIEEASAGISGDWDVTIESPRGSRTVRFAFGQEGSKLTGTMLGQGADAPVQGRIEGSEVQFSYTIQLQENELDIAMTGTLDGDSIQGDADFGGLAKGRWKGVRVAGAPPGSAVNISGRWALKVQTPQGTREVSATFETADARLDGKLMSPLGELPFTGSITGNQVEFSYVVSFQDNELPITMSGTVHEDSMTGTADFGGLAEGDWTGIRLAEVAVPTVNLSGEWELTINSPQGSRDVRASFESEGEQLSGKLISPLGELPFAGTLTGNQVEFSYVIQFQDNEFPITMSGIVEGDEMTGDADFGGLAQGDWTGQRLESLETVPDVSGSWDVTIHSPQGTHEVSAMLHSEGTRLTGTLVGDNGEVPFEGMIDGNKIRFSYVMQFQDNELPITITGEVKGDTIEGEADFGGFAQGNWSAARSNAAAMDAGGGNLNSAADVTGEWIFEVETDLGSGSPVFKLIQEGESLRGTYSGIFGQSELQGNVKDNQIRFSFPISAQGMEGTVVYTGTIEEDVMHGTATVGDLGEATWKARRHP